MDTIKKNNALTTFVMGNYQVFLFVVVLFLFGVIFGTIIFNSTSDNQKMLLSEYLSKFLNEVKNGNISYSKSIIKDSLIENIKYVGLIWLLGISVIGIPIICLMLFIRGAIIGFSIGFLINHGGWNGLELACTSILPQNLILVPLVIFVTSSSILISIHMFKRQFMNSTNEPIRPTMRIYTILLLISLGLILIASIVEAFIAPLLMKTVL